MRQIVPNGYPVPVATGGIIKRKKGKPFKISRDYNQFITPSGMVYQRISKSEKEALGLEVNVPIVATNPQQSVDNSSLLDDTDNSSSSRSSSHGSSSSSADKHEYIDEIQYSPDYTATGVRVFCPKCNSYMYEHIHIKRRIY